MDSREVIFPFVGEIADLQEGVTLEGMKKGTGCLEAVCNTHKAGPRKSHSGYRRSTTSPWRQRPRGHRPGFSSLRKLLDEIVS